MKSNLIMLLSIIFVSINSLSQEFSTKPFTVVNDWISKNISLENLKNTIPSGFEIALEEEEKLVLEKKVGSKVFEIKVFYKNSKISGVMFTQHIDRAFKLMIEITDDLKFIKNDKEYSSTDFIERIVYENVTKTKNARILINENERIITCFINKIN